MVRTIPCSDVITALNLHVITFHFIYHAKYNMEYIVINKCATNLLVSTLPVNQFSCVNITVFGSYQVFDESISLRIFLHGIFYVRV